MADEGQPVGEAREAVLAWGSLPSQFAHFDLYRSFARYRWTTTLNIFDTSAASLASDPHTHRVLRSFDARGRSMLEGFQSGLELLRSEDPDWRSSSDEQLLEALVRRRESLRFEVALFHIYAKRPGPSPFRQFLDLDLEALERVRRLLGQYRACLFTGPHVGPYDAMVPIVCDLLGFERPWVYYDQPASSFEDNVAFVERSNMPNWIKPRMVAPDDPMRNCVDLLSSGNSILMLSDVTTRGKKIGRFKAELAGRVWHAPSGPVRMVHEARVPMVTFALTRSREEDSWRLWLDVVYVPEEHERGALADETIDRVLASKWGCFDNYRRADPLAWDGLALWEQQPLLAK